MLALTIYQMWLYVTWPLFIWYLLINLKPVEQKSLVKAIGSYTIISVLMGIIIAGFSLVAMTRSFGSITPNTESLNLYFGLEFLFNGFFLMIFAFNTDNIIVWRITYSLYLILNFIAIGLLMAYIHDGVADLTLWGGTILAVILDVILIVINHYFLNKFNKYLLYIGTIITIINGFQYLPIPDFASHVFWHIDSCCTLDKGSPYMIFQHIFGVSARLTMADMLMYIIIIQLVIIITLIINIITEEKRKMEENHQRFSHEV